MHVQEQGREFLGLRTMQLTSSLDFVGDAGFSFLVVVVGVTQKLYLPRSMLFWAVFKAVGSARIESGTNEI